MSRKEVIMHPIETIRVAPLGCAAIAFFTSMGSATMYEFVHSDNLPVKVVALGTAAISAFGEVMGAKLVGEQMVLKERFEGIMDRRGYNDRIMAERTDEWCRSSNRARCL